MTTAFLASTLSSFATFFGTFGNGILVFDARAEYFFVAARDLFLTRFFSIVTLLGEWHIALGILLAVSVVLWFLDKRSFLLPLWVSVFGAEIITMILKNIIMRPRPETAVIIENSFSFPSGHATIAVAFYGFLAYILFRICRTRKEKIVVCAIGTFLILLIGLSRLYLGVHYVSDVIAGYLIGAVGLSLGMCLAEHFCERKKQV